jgi:hypothetical protein
LFTGGFYLPQRKRFCEDLVTYGERFFLFGWLFSILILAREEEWGFVEDGISAVVMENRV